MIARLSSLLILATAAACGAGGTVSAQDRPGECVSRRVTGPGGAYRWDRVECEANSGWSDFDRWGYDRQSEDGRYDASYPTYRVAGRDADGFLVWPGKLP